jgi:hypothetical protein
MGTAAIYNAPNAVASKGLADADPPAASAEIACATRSGLMRRMPASVPASISVCDAAATALS